MPEPILVLHQVTKRFPGVTALNGVSLAVEDGACHALLGENGAGKSTLGKLVAGIHTPDGGALTLATRPGAPPQPVRFRSPLQAAAAGVRIVHQEPAFCRNLSIAENLFLGRLPTVAGFVQHATLASNARALLRRVGLEREPATVVGDLSTAEEQLVQIAAAVDSRARLIIFDEPTSSLSDVDVERLFERIAELRRAGVTILYVSHRLAEIRRLCDYVTVLRDGRHVRTCPTADVTDDELVRLMAGRDVVHYTAGAPAVGPPLLELESYSDPPRFDNVSLTVRRGEIVGLAGLVGAGRSALAQSIFGIRPPASGDLRLAGRAAHIASPTDAIRRRIGFLPEDRQLQGLLLSMSCGENVTLARLPQLSRGGLLRRRAERQLARELIEQLRVRTPGIDAPAAGLSGGNQQKLALGKWLACECDLLILDEPTRGVDVAAKAEIHQWIGRLAAAGSGILLITSDLPELLALSTRILVMRGGRLVGELPRDQATADGVLRRMAGVG
jgi:ABC-type sugar transport system ATPase subunit